MKMSVTQNQIPTSVTILRLEGSLDSSNNENLVVEARNLFAAGVRDLILDLSKLTFISSAGLRAFHIIAQLFQSTSKAAQGESWDEYRWTVYNGTKPGQSRGIQEHVKLLSPTKEVREVLDLIGFSFIFEIFTDLNQATASFQATNRLMETSQQ
jgi:anti-anti-sigma factor